MKLKVNKKAVLTGLAAVFGAGAFIVDVLNKGNETDEAAEKAAKIVMKKLSKDENQGPSRSLVFVFIFMKGETKTHGQIQCESIL